ncbi:unnamed protein product [Sphagnum troendelagicum]|uniref:Uncharacterized protein n=1 Tax=Sphagnum troendelagicum TaxID=128251 RepID=A0ABP0TD77_9BRYO
MPIPSNTFSHYDQGSDWRIEGSWCKIDKPDRVLDLEASKLEAFKKAYSFLGADLGGVKLL